MAFDRLGLVWEYEPRKFDMGPMHFSYTPDFSVASLSIPDSARPLYIEVKQFPYEKMNLTKYVQFTAWYKCDLLVLAHEDCDLEKKKGDVLKPKNKRYFLVLRCPHCTAYDWFPCPELPADDEYKPAAWDEVLGESIVTVTSRTCRLPGGSP